jgi:hypothetical protein
LIVVSGVHQLLLLLPLRQRVLLLLLLMLMLRLRLELLHRLAVGGRSSAPIRASSGPRMTHGWWVC